MSNALANRRRLRRHQLSGDIKVIDGLQRQPMGQLVNIHEEGLLIMGPHLNLQSSHQVKLMLPHNINQQSECELGIECLWSQATDAEDELYWSGCSIIDLSPAAEICIQMLINIRSK